MILETDMMWDSNSKQYYPALIALLEIKMVILPE
ncbi:hypothetical protein RHORCCE3_1777, partial [Rickettsia hoogstraalii str. RCCE3]